MISETRPSDLLWGNNILLLFKGMVYNNFPVNTRVNVVSYSQVFLGLSCLRSCGQRFSVETAFILQENEFIIAKTYEINKGKI